VAKDKLTEYDATAANNTVVGDVNLAENSALPSDMNNAVRELMSHQKEAFGSGTPLYVDQTNNRVGVGTAAPATAGVGLHVQTSSTSISDTVTADVQAIFERNGNAGIAIVSGASSVGSLKFGAPGDVDGGRIVYSQSEDSMRFLTADQERIRITSTGRLGVGTSAPAHNVEIVATNAGSVNDSLQIRNNATSTGTGSRIRFINSTDKNSDANGASIASVRNGNDNDLVFETENSEAMRILSTGHVLMPFQPVAAVSYSGSDISPTTVIPLNSGGFTRGAMTTSSDRITVPVAGAYFVGFHHLGATSGAQIQIRVNGSAVAGGQTQEASGGNDNVSAQDILNLSANDYIEFAVVSNGSIHGNANFNRMYAYLIG